MLRRVVPVLPRVRDTVAQSVGHSPMGERLGYAQGVCHSPMVGMRGVHNVVHTIHPGMWNVHQSAHNAVP